MTKLIGFLFSSAFWVGISFVASVYFLHDGASDATAYKNTLMGMFVLTAIMGRCNVPEMFLYGSAFATAVSAGCWASYQYTGGTWIAYCTPIAFFFGVLMALSVATGRGLSIQSR